MRTVWKDDSNNNSYKTVMSFHNYRACNFIEISCGTELQNRYIKLSVLSIFTDAAQLHFGTLSKNHNKICQIKAFDFKHREELFRIRGLSKLFSKAYFNLKILTIRKSKNFLKFY